jgi:hypothetical protein
MLPNYLKDSTLTHIHTYIINTHVYACIRPYIQINKGIHTYTHTYMHTHTYISYIVQHTSGPGSSVGIAIEYGLDGAGIKSRWGEIFRICPDRPWGPPNRLYNGYRVFPGVESGRGVTMTPHPLLVPRSRERIELYLYSPQGPLWPTTGRNLPTTYTYIHTHIHTNIHSYIYTIIYTYIRES